MSSNFLKIVLSVILLATIGCGGDDNDGGGKDKTSSDAASKTEDKSGMQAVGNLTETLSQVSTMIAGIKNPQTAQFAAQQIDQMTGNLNIDGLANLPGPAKLAAGEVVSRFRGTVEKVLENVYAMDGVEDVLKPSVDGLLNKLDDVSE
ncbi:MAG: hypothetical protein ACR2NP_22835 [Pirellulaceae bacterium]